MEDKPLTDSINKQYSKYGSLRMKEKESKLELCNAEDPKKFLLRIDSSIKDAKARVKMSIDNSSISEDYESSLDQQPNDNSLVGTIPLVNLEKNKASSSKASQLSEIGPATITTATAVTNEINATTMPSMSSLQAQLEERPW